MITCYLRYCLAAVFMLACVSVYAQQQRPGVLMELNPSPQFNIASMVVSDTAGDMFSLFAVDQKQFVTVLLNDRMEVQKQYAFTQVTPTSFEYMLGGSSRDSVFTAFFDTGHYGEFGYITVDYAAGQGSDGVLSLDFQGDWILDMMEVKGRFCVITIPRGTPQFNVYELLPDASYKKTEFPVPQLEKLYNWNHDPARSAYRFTSLKDGAYVTIPQTMYFSKLYGSDQKFILTLDRYLQKTEVITLDLHTGQVDYRAIPQQLPKNRRAWVSNSMVHREKLYQVSANYKYFKLDIHDLDTKQVVASYGFARGKAIPFQNTPIVQEKKKRSVVPMSRKLGKSRKLLLKMSKSRVGIAVNETPSGLIELTIGSYLERFVEGYDREMPIEVKEGLTLTLTLPSNPYTLIKSASFSSLLDPVTLRHVPGTPEGGFATPVSYPQSDRVTADIYGKTSFLVGRNRVAGWYDNIKKKYELLKFSTK